MMGVIIISALVGAFVPIFLNKRGIEYLLLLQAPLSLLPMIFSGGLNLLGLQNDLAFDDSLPEVLAKIGSYDGLILRSKFTIDKEFLLHAKNLKFIGRVGSGLENIDMQAVKKMNIHLISSPEGNRNAVGEHCLGMLLGLMNNLKAGHESIKSGQWDREEIEDGN